YNVPITMHVSEMDYELAYYREAYDQTPIEYLESIGLLSERFVAAHCIFMEDEDMKLMKSNGVRIAHCIGSNTKAAKGVAPIRQALELGIPVGLGSDGASSGNTLDIFTQFKLFANFHKLANKDRGIFPAHQIVRLGTMGGASVLGKAHEIGSIEMGKKADLVLVETDSVNMFPVFDPYSALVYSANASNVDTVFVNGKCLVRNKELVHVKLGEVRKELQEAMLSFEKKAKEQLEKIL
ncbi:MAG: amidohydrolase family protein, partial [Cellulosilyticaceae bacterium]